MSELPLIYPDWPAPASVGAVSTFREGGVSLPPYDSLNLGLYVGDDRHRVISNRRRLANATGLRQDALGWLEQIHGTAVVRAPVTGVPRADASVAMVAANACVILTADCLPVLLCDRSGTRVAAAHAGWRGLCEGVLERTVEALENPRDLMAWLGPAIGPDVYEVGPEVRSAFMARASEATAAFRPARRPGHYLCDLYLLARQRLAAVGVTQVYGGQYCTLTDRRFFSFRRDGRTGRQASAVWLQTPLPLTSD